MSDLPPIPHPEVRAKARPGPVLVRFEFSSAFQPERDSLAGETAWFGPFETVWIYGGTLMARNIDGDTEYELSQQIDVPAYGGAVWHAPDDRYYTDAVFLHMDTRLDVKTDLELFGSLIIEDVKRRVKDAESFELAARRT